MVSFDKLQSIGKALMLPVAVLPAAAILLRLGASDVLNIDVIEKAGGTIFDNLPTIFAIGIAFGLVRRIYTWYHSINCKASARR